MERRTRQKESVYRALVALGHPSATELYEYVHAQDAEISRSTVFRVLSDFASAGRARRLCFTGSDDRFDATLAPHAHLHCRKCGRIFDIPMPDMRSDGDTVGRFLIEQCYVEFCGVCAACQGADGADEGF